MLSVGLALSAGFCAATASLCAKLAFSSQHIFEDSCKFVDFWIVGCSNHCDKVSYDFCLCFIYFFFFKIVLVSNFRRPE